MKDNPLITILFHPQNVNVLFSQSISVSCLIDIIKGKILNLKDIMDNMYLVLTRTFVSSLTELCNLCYCAAQVVTEECGISLPAPVSLQN